MKTRTALLVVFFLCAAVSLRAQFPDENSVLRVARDHIGSFYEEPGKEVLKIDTLYFDKEPDLFILSLENGGWIMLAADKKVQPVVAYSLTEDFFTVGQNPACEDLLSFYSTQVKEAREEKGLPVHEGWNVSKDELKSASDDKIVVEPLIKARWNQGSGWNRFCPEDPDGPGGRTYVGCVAVAMAQALSVYNYPDTGSGSAKYRENYGVIEANFGETHYKWDSMSLYMPDDYNALLLYHCAVSVSMSFGPDGSSASTKESRSALRQYFKMTGESIYWTRENHEDIWEQKIIDDLRAGRPLIFKGNADDGESGHAFNIDGVNGDGSKGINYFHVNWGWGGSRNGYYLISSLKPGTRDYSKNNAAVFKLQPLYYPTGIRLSDTIAPISVPRGSAVARVRVEDEAVDNEYNIFMISDSVFIEDEWVYDYYLDGDSIRTGRVFMEDDEGQDTLKFYITDKYENYVEGEVVVTVSDTSAAATAIDDSRYDLFRVYPNPTGGIITIDPGDDLSPYGLRIYSQSGIEVKKISPVSGQKVLDLSGLASGWYILEISFTDGIAIRKKFLKI